MIMGNGNLAFLLRQWSSDLLKLNLAQPCLCRPIPWHQASLVCSFSVCPVQAIKVISLFSQLTTAVHDGHGTFHQ